jgi:hypothetical protein
VWFVLPALLLPLLRGIPAAHAEVRELGIATSRLVLKLGAQPKARRLVFTAKDDAIRPTADPSRVTSSIVLVSTDPAGETTGLIALDPRRWKAVKRGYRYKDARGSRGGIKKILFKPGKLVIKGGGSAFTWSGDRLAPRSVSILFQVGIDWHCATAAGKTRGAARSVLTARNAAQETAVSPCTDVRAFGVRDEDDGDDENGEDTTPRGDDDSSSSSSDDEPKDDDDECRTADDCDDGDPCTVDVCAECPDGPHAVVVADATTHVSNPDQNCNDSDLEGDFRSAKRAYVAIRVTGTADRQITGVTLRLTAASQDGSDSDHGGRIQPTSCDWDELKITWANQPDVEPIIVDEWPHKVKKGEVVEFDLTSAITGDGLFCFALTSPSEDVIRYFPREKEDGPEVELTVSGSSGTCEGDTTGKPCTHIPDDDCAPTTCAVDGAPCDDGLFCTLTGVCQGGQCLRGPERNCGDGNACTADSCDESGRRCVNDPGPLNGASCDDGRFCTGPDDTDTCQHGVCTGPPRDCGGNGDPCTAGICDEAGRRCVVDPSLTDGLPCDDGLFCTGPNGTDACRGGTCTGPPRTCSDDNACTADVCDEVGRRCINDARPHDGMPCDDGRFCTDPDICQGGVCSGASRDCGSGEQCKAYVCDEQGRRCVSRNDTDGAPCDDGLFCTASDTCNAGTCTGTPRACGDGNPCTLDRCDETLGKCLSDPGPLNGTTCNDGRFCTGPTESPDRCVDGLCTGPPRSCTDMNDCTVDACNETTARCVHTPVNDGQLCNDGLFCTLDDACMMGMCMGRRRSCDDSNPCTIDFCDESIRHCSNDPAPLNGAACDDGRWCTGPDGKDRCEAGQCTGPPRNCNDDNECTDDLCDDVNDRCVNATEPADGRACDDWLFCTGPNGDRCQRGTCSGPPRNCNDGNQCTTDECSELRHACVNETGPLDGTRCDDGLFCTGAGDTDTCQRGTCAGPQRTCDDFSECTVDSCNETFNRCDNLAGPLENTPCDDGDVCTGVGGTDRCVGGECLGEPICEDNNPCTLDTCTSSGECRFELVTDPTFKAPADFIVVIEASMSMRSDLRTWIPPQLGEALPAALEAAGIDYRLAIVRYATNQRYDTRSRGGPPVPDLYLPWTSDRAVYMDAITRLPDAPRRQTESGTEAINFALEHLRFRNGALRNVILYTDEDDDAPVCGASCVGGSRSGSACTMDEDCSGGQCVHAVRMGACRSGERAGQTCTVDDQCPKSTCENVPCDKSIERREPPARGPVCYGLDGCEEKWRAHQQRIDETAAKLIQKQVQLNIVMNNSDPPSIFQYGDPYCTVVGESTNRLDFEPTLECLKLGGRWHKRRRNKPQGICTDQVCEQGRRGDPCTTDEDCNAYSIQAQLLASGSCGPDGFCATGRVGFACERATEVADCGILARAYSIPRTQRHADDFFPLFIADKIREQSCASNHPPGPTAAGGNGSVSIEPE